MSITFTMDGRQITADEGQSILAAALAGGIDIPHICWDPKLSPGGNCGLCLVSVNGGEPVPACETKAEQDMVVISDSPAITELRKEALKKLLETHRGDCVAPCQKACPAHTNCQGYAGLIAEGHFDEALRLLKESYPIPASLGRICPHYCEAACRRSLFEAPVSLAALKRFAGDYGLRSGAREMPVIPEDTGKKIAVIGAGPAGLTAAWLLRMKGHGVTVFEAMPEAGGLLKYGIPDFRLPGDILDAEIAFIKEAGVEFRFNSPVTEEKFETLRKEYDAVFLAIGAWGNSKLNIPGEDLPQVIGGLEFLRRTSEKDYVKLGRRVAVVGGDNIAVDSARTAIRMPQVEEVTVLYYRTEGKMPAIKDEVALAREEGVAFRFLMAPSEVREEADGIRVTLQQMKLGEPDASGISLPVPVEGVTEDFACDNLIIAAGQSPSGFAPEGLARNKKGAFITGSAAQTEIPGVFAGGDATNNGPDIAVKAVGDAQRAARAIDLFLKGEDIEPAAELQARQTDLTREDFPGTEVKERRKASALSPDDRRKTFNECTETLTEEQAVAEASRCLECGCIDYYECQLVKYANLLNVPFVNDMSVPHVQTDKRQPYIFRDPNKCIACGLCVRVCREIMGYGVWEMIEEDGKKTVRIKDGKTMPENFCVSCGQCVEHCPVGALTEQNPYLKPVPLRPEEQVNVCNYCAVGCPANIKHYGDKPLKVSPVYGGNLDANVLCVHGRLGWQTAMGNRNLTDPWIRTESGQKKAGWDEAYDYAAAELRKIQEKYGKDSVGVLIADRMTAEETYQALRLAEAIGTSSIYSANIFDGGVEDVFGLDGSTNTYQELAMTDNILVVAADVPSYYAMLALPVQQAKFGRGAKLNVVAADGWNGFNFIADRRAVMEDDTRFVKEMIKDCIDSGCVPENATGFEELKESLKDVVPGEEAKAFARDYREAENAMIMIDRERISRETARLVCELAVICGKIGRKYNGIIQMLQHNETQAVSLMKIRKNINHLYEDINSGKVRAMVLAEQYIPDESVVPKLDFVALMDTAEDPAFAYADVFLPMPGYGSFDGTYLSAEGRMQKLTRVFSIPSGRDGWEVLEQFASRFGAETFGELEKVQKAMADRYWFFRRYFNEGEEFITESPIRYADGKYATPDGKAKLFPALEKSEAFEEMCFADVALTVWFGELVTRGVLTVD